VFANKINGFRPVWTPVDITSNTFYKCTATFRTLCTIKTINAGIRVHKNRDMKEQENEEDGVRRMERKGCDRIVEEKLRSEK
jgi:hypothetical protein